MGKDTTNSQSKDKDRGFIFLHRKIFSNKYYFSEPFTKSSAWIDLLLLANFTDSYFEVRGIGVPVKRGQLAYSQLTLAQRWRWSIGKVKRFLFVLKMDGQIDYQNTNVTTLITILNYDQYQIMDEQTDWQTETKRKPNRRHNKNDNNDKNIRVREKSKFIPPTLEDVEQYFLEKGYARGAAKRAFDYYNVADWKDSHGNKVRNWKQKMHSVWFKDENRMKSEIPQTLSYAIS